MSAESTTQSLRELLVLQRNLEDQIINAEGEVTDDIFNQLTLIGGSTPAKVDGIMSFLDHCQSKAKEWKDKADTLTSYSKMYLNTYNRCRSYVKTTMITSGYDEVLGNYLKFSIEKTDDVVEILDESRIPEEYLRIKKTPDKEKLAIDLKLGKSIPGAILIPGFKLAKRAADKKRKQENRNEIQTKI